MNMLDYIDRYEEYLRQLPLLRGQSGGPVPVLGFCSDCDVVLKWDAERYNSLLDTWLKEFPSAVQGDVIRSMEDFVRFTAAYMLRGSGAMIEVETVDLCERIHRCFDSEYALGGTGAQAAAALGAVGMPSCVHLSDDSPEVCRQLDYEGVTLIVSGAERPAGSFASGNRPIYHIILQFDEGDVIRVEGKEHVIPHSNRIILVCDELVKLVPLRQDFLDYWADSAHAASSLVISGLDSILDLNIARERAEQLVKFLERFRAAHPKAVIYLEGAFYLTEEVKDLLFAALAPHVDVIGMNEEELIAYAGPLLEEPDSAEEILRALDLFHDQYPSGGLILHTRDFCMYRGRRIEGADLERGLTMGNLMSATRARIGRYGDRAECAETLALPLSPKGLRIREEVLERETAGAEDGLLCIVVPTRLMERPKYTIGLGDTFVAGVQTAFLG